MKTELTRKEALEEGFTKCGYADREWQSVMNISDLIDDDFSDNIIILAHKESSCPSISKEDIIDLLAENISERHSDEFGDDTDGVYDIVRSIDFEPTAKMINEALSNYQYWMMTDITLVP